MFKKMTMLLLVGLLVFLVACDKGPDYPKAYGIVDVISGEETEDGVVLTLETDGFGGTITAEVTVLDGLIVSYEVTQHTESTGWGKALIEDGALIQALIDESDDLSSVDVQDFLDADAGATVTGEALLDIALTAIEHYEEDYQ